jgi:CBS domain containing-hemolysin-like protein
MSAELAAILISVGLIVGNAFFVAAEYALIGARRSRIEAMAKRGHRAAKLTLAATQDMSRYVAAVQVAITMFGIGVGSITEPFLTDQLGRLLGAQIPQAARVLISILIVTFVLVVLGELFPKYLVLRSPDRAAFATIRPLRVFVAVLSPLAWLAQTATQGIFRIFGMKVKDTESDAVPKEELLMMVRAGSDEGILEKGHADFVSRALRLDALDARDIMVHRLDMKWLDVSLGCEELLERLAVIPYSRLPVCRGDIDDMVGIVYLHDVVRHLEDKPFSLESLVRPLVAIPENLPVDKIIQTMRDEKTQMLIVLDEYGGTSGLITLEDVVEEVFGEMEDRLESERPPIEQLANGRVSARADVRYDELVDRLELRVEDSDNTDTLATILINALERVPRPGDSVETELGLMRVENMARRRITRVSLQLAEAIRPSPEAE